MKPGKFCRLTEQEIADIRTAHARRLESLRTVKYLQSKHGLTTQGFSQIAIGKTNGRKPRPHARTTA
jgi:hypothetical protein